MVRGSPLGRSFPGGGGNEQIFGWWRDSPHSPLVMKTLLYQAFFPDFSNLIHCIQNFGNQCKIKWTREKKVKKRKIKKRNRIRKKKKDE